MLHLFDLDICLFYQHKMSHTQHLLLKKEIGNLEFHNCKDFLEMAMLIKSCKFFIGNQSVGYDIAEALKIPRLLEGCPYFPVIKPHGKRAYDFFYQVHFEKWFNHLYHL